MRTPNFWYEKESLVSKCLVPVAFIWKTCAYIKKISSNTSSMQIPVIKVGNIVIGGAGKTPVVISIAKRLINFKIKVHIISKGYKGSIKETTRVNNLVHNFYDVGDEALLLSEIAPTWIGKNRIDSIKAAQKKGAEIVILDDGLQDHTIKGDLNIIVFNGFQGIGNGKIIPAGPLREPISWALRDNHLAIIVEEDKKEIYKKLSNTFPILKAKVTINNSVQKKLLNKRILAFCGLGYPEKFYEFLKELGCIITSWKTFPDHHVYSEKTLENLLNESKNLDSCLVTTQKDHVKIIKKYRNKIFSFPIDIKISDYATLDSMIYSTINMKNKK
ncbi:MAG: Tetraacyldisaccharide 4'-kinase [Alphaproteobacteria bacterium MarineAlpha9_Bin1]|nr:MAG: Tetraacyldisaccharide 4'-kinase [Alphaproteobacteria bacterium MarineAlpha9_Bin1]